MSFDQSGILALGLRLAWATLGLAFLSCGAEEQDGDAGVRLQRRVHPLPLPTTSPMELDVLVHAEATLGVQIFGEGSVRCAMRTDEETFGEQVVAGVHANALTTLEIPLPGKGTRALRLHWEWESGIQWHQLLLLDELPAFPDATSIPASLLGRSVILLVADALGAKYLGCNGGVPDPSPQLNSLASRGVLFTRAYSQTCWTVPSVGTLLTGQEQERHGLRDVGVILGPTPATLADAFKAQGYSTAAFVQNPILSAKTGLARGFDQFEERTGDLSGALLPDVQRWLAEHQDQCFFLYVHLLPPHAPYTPPDPFPEKLGAKSQDPIDGSMKSVELLNKQSAGLEHPGIRQITALYRANVAYVDSLIGELMSTLNELQLTDKLLLVFLSDHGEALGERGFVGHNLHVYEEMVRVPMILCALDSALPSGKTIDAAVSLTDVFPTLVELLSLEAPAGLEDGCSLAGLLEGKATVHRRPLRLSSRYVKDGPKQRAIVLGSFKLLQVRGGETRLFDLETDPGERTDVSANHPILYGALVRSLREWEQGLLSVEEAERFSVDADMARLLHEIGYVEEDRNR